MYEVINELQAANYGLAGMTRERVVVTPEEPGFNPPLRGIEKQILRYIRRLILSSDFQRELYQNPVYTFAMVRAHLEQGSESGSDLEIFAQVMARIEEEFDPIIKFSAFMTPAFADQFYKDVKPRLEDISAEPPFTSVWDRFNNLLTTGATTFLVLRPKDPTTEPGFQRWRDFIGATIPANAHIGTLRREFGSDTNNIVHGSDSIESVQRETRLFAREIGTFIR